MDKTKQLVQITVYDFILPRWANEILDKKGIYHTGVVVGDTEFSYDPSSKSGVRIQPYPHVPPQPGAIVLSKLIRTVPIGETTVDPLSVVYSAGFRAEDYRPFANNCNDFTSALVSRLGLTLPPDIVRNEGPRNIGNQLPGIVRAALLPF